METGYLLSEIAQMSGGTLLGDSSSKILRLFFDSRLVFEPEGALFFALKGGQNNGHYYIPELYSKGVRFFVVDRDYKPAPAMTDAGWVFVDDTLKALQDVAAFHRRQYHPQVLAVTGSNGKTIVKEWLAQALNDDVPMVRSPRSYNSQIGVPLSVWQLNARHRLAVFEAGISRKGEMSRLKEIIQPTLGLITNIGTAHLENFESQDAILDEKLGLFDDVEVLFYSRDAQLIHEAVMARWPHKKCFTWGRHPESDLRLISSGETLTFQWKGKRFEAEIPFVDFVSVENVMPVVLFMLFRGYNESLIAQRVAALEPVAMRMERKEGLNNCLIINDSYNSDFTSLEIALDFLDQQGRQKAMSRTVILSDMLQTGYADSLLYPRVAELLQSRKIDRLIGVGDHIINYQSSFRTGDRFFRSTDELLAALPGFSFRNEAILIKGARSFAFERVSDLLEQKQHCTVMEVNLDALINNLNVFRQHLNPNTRVLAMVKAFSYGSGSYEIAAALQYHKVDYLGVAFADEGMELRRAGITLPIIVMNPELKTFGQMLEYGLEPEVYSFKVLKAFERAVRESGIPEASVHIKLDTGMNRFGFEASDADELVRTIKAMPHIKVRSVLSHLVGSDDVKHDDFTHRQIDIFDGFTAYLKSKLGYSFIRHILNSAGIERFSENQYEMVRIGIGMYGLSAVNDARMQNVVTLKSYVSQVREVHDDATVGYGRKGFIKTGGKLAVIPVGYADGLNRHLSNGVGEVLINGQLYPIIGNICMDTCMIDVSNSNVLEGDEVIIFGDDYPVTVLSDKLNTIPYEVLTGISRRVKRIYYRE